MIVEPCRAPIAVSIWVVPLLYYAAYASSPRSPTPNNASQLTVFQMGSLQAAVKRAPQLPGPLINCQTHFAKYVDWHLYPGPAVIAISVIAKSFDHSLASIVRIDPDELPRISPQPLPLPPFPTISIPPITPLFLPSPSPSPSPSSSPSPSPSPSTSPILPQQQQPQQQQQQQGQTNVSAILGGVLSGVSVIGGILTLLLLWWYLRDKKQEKKFRETVAEDPDEMTLAMGSSRDSHPHDLENGAAATTTVRHAL
ncbi:hypothetical protein BDY19DRAFT_1045531 [Irpex rosettiformis]|uniref:Uncharacterized protein n=1 Tax=Irpex rosettiformis TaxID=378272 RepID=A0ACB8UG89_9APHY|nr:hypothetical protein BDY19DRAFT_1045531 [Irpex rosettiformis]